MSVAFGGSYDYTWLGDRVIQAVHDRIHAQLQQTGQEVVAIAQQLAPVDTGALSRSIEYAVGGSGSQQTLEISVGVPYGLYQEFGTRTMSPQPFIRPALAAVQRIWGAGAVMNFTAVPTANPIKVHGSGFKLPKNLTDKQRSHVKSSLAPMSRRLNRGNAKKAKLRIRRTAL